MLKIISDNNDKTPYRTYAFGLILIVLSSLMYAASPTTRTSTALYIAYALLIIAALLTFATTILLESIRWLSMQFASESKFHHAPPSPHWLKLAFVLTFFWAVIAAEKLWTELSTEPEMQSVELVRTFCSKQTKGGFSRLVPVDVNGDWCFSIVGYSTQYHGRLYTFPLPPNTFSPAPKVEDKVNGWLVSYDSNVFGPRAYLKVVGKLLENSKAGQTLLEQ